MSNTVRAAKVNFTCLHLVCGVFAGFCFGTFQFVGAQYDVVALFLSRVYFLLVTTYVFWSSTNAYLSSHFSESLYK